MTFILSETGFYLSILVVMDKMVDRNDNLWSQSMDIVVMIIVFGYSITNSMQQLIMIYHSIFDVSIIDVNSLKKKDFVPIIHDFFLVFLQTKKNVIFHVYLLRWSFIVIASILSFGVLPFFFSPSDPIAIQSVHIIFCFSIGKFFENSNEFQILNLNFLLFSYFTAAELTSTMVKGLQKTFSKRIPAIFFYFVHLALIIAGISMLGFTWLTFQLKQFDFTSYKQLIISDTMSFLFVASYITIFSIGIYEI